MYDLMMVLVVVVGLLSVLHVTGDVTYGQVHPIIQRVYYEGTDTLYTGYALCYNQDYGTAANVDESRMYRVEKPSTSNNMFFAGVVAPNSSGKTGPCWIDIFRPGSLCEVYTNQNCTISTTQEARITFEAGQYYFGGLLYGFPGQGSAIVKQTKDRSSTAGLVQAELEVGQQSGGIEHVTPANGAMTIMLGGVTLFPVTTIAVGNATYTLADGIQPGQRKAFFCEGTMTTSDIVITVTSEMAVGEWPMTAAAAAFNTWTMDAAAEYLTCEWKGKSWLCYGLVGTTV